MTCFIKYSNNKDAFCPFVPGTDATHAEHIETIKSRMYVGLTADQRFLPGELGMGLVEGALRQPMESFHRKQTPPPSHVPDSLQPLQVTTPWATRCPSRTCAPSWRPT